MLFLALFTIYNIYYHTTCLGLNTVTEYINKARRLKLPTVRIKSLRWVAAGLIQFCFYRDMIIFSIHQKTVGVPCARAS